MYKSSQEQPEEAKPEDAEYEIVDEEKDEKTK